MDAKGKLEKSAGKALVIMLALSFFVTQLAFPYVLSTDGITITNVSASKTGDKVQGSAPEHQTIYVEPSYLQVIPCTNFTVNVNVRNVTDLYGWQFNMTFDPNLMQCVSLTYGPFLSSNGANFVWMLPGINNAIGEIKACASILYPPQGVNGSGTLATITFHCTAPGGSVLHLHDTTLLNSSAVVVGPPPEVGDLDGNHKVDIKDVVIVAKAYCSKVGDPRYNSTADLNSDGAVDIMDLIIVTRNYGHMYPPHPALQPVNNIIAHTVEDGYVTQYTPIHDVAITNVSPSKTVVCLGYNITINVALKNNGNYMETFTVWTFCGLHQNITLPSLTSTTIHYTFSTSKLKKGTYRVWAYAPMPDDARPNDNIGVGNTFIVSMVGDICSEKSGPYHGWPDGRCDMSDIYPMCKLFGVQYPNPKYDPNFDLNNDNRIDMADLYVLCKQFGKKDP